MNRLTMIVIAAILFAAPQAGAASKISVLKSAGCGCCNIWIKKLRSAGFKVEARDTTPPILGAAKRKYKIGPDSASCHTATVAGYVIEGHVPIREIRRLLREKPKALGLTVPGMPIGSPGMENGTEREAFDVLLIKPDGSLKVYARYAARK